MTNTELIRQEIERRIGAMYNFSSGYSALNTCRELLDFIDSLPKEDQKVYTDGDFARGYDCGYECCLNSHGAEWLEKQKEQKSEQSEMEKEYVRTLHSLIADFLRGKQEIDREYYQKIWDWLDNRHIEQKPDIEICPHSIKSKSYSVQKPATFSEPYNPDDYEVVLEGNATSLRRKEQKPAEWSEEDERFRMICSECVGYHYIDGLIKKETYEKVTKWLKSLRIQAKQWWRVEDESNLQSCIAKIEIDMQHWDKHGKTMVDGDIKLIDWLRTLPERFNLPPKQEWSEDDEEMLNTILSFSPILKGLAECNMILGREGNQVKVIDKCNAWLKSLRPQSHWNPSEEQMDELEKVSSGNTCAFNYGILRKLYDDLKKL